MQAIKLFFSALYFFCHHPRRSVFLRSQNLIFFISFFQQTTSSLPRFPLFWVENGNQQQREITIHYRKLAIPNTPIFPLLAPCNGPVPSPSPFYIFCLDLPGVFIINSGKLVSKQPDSPLLLQLRYSLSRCIFFKIWQEGFKLRPSLLLFCHF